MGATYTARMYRPLALLLSLVIAGALVAQTPAEDANVLIREAVSLMDSGRFDDAIAKLRTVLTNDPANNMARYELGLAYAAKGDDAQCLTVFEPVRRCRAASGILAGDARQLSRS